MKPILSGLFAALLAVSACAVPTPVAQTEIVDRSYARYSSSGAVKLMMGVKVSELNGKVMLCGAIAGDGAHAFLGMHMEYWRDNSVISVGGEKIAQGIAYAPLYQGEATVMGKTAKCGVSSKPWKASYASEKVTVRILSGYVGS